MINCIKLNHWISIKFLIKNDKLAEILPARDCLEFVSGGTISCFR